MLKGTTLITTLAAAASVLQGCCCQFPNVNRDDYIVALQLWYLQSSNSVKLITTYFNTLRSGVAAKSIHSLQIDAAKQSVGPHWYLIGIKSTSAAQLLHFSQTTKPTPVLDSTMLASLKIHKQYLLKFNALPCFNHQTTQCRAH